MTVGYFLLILCTFFVHVRSGQAIWDNFGCFDSHLYGDSSFELVHPWVQDVQFATQYPEGWH